MNRIYHRRTQRTPRTAEKHGADSANDRKSPCSLRGRRIERSRFRERQPKTPHPRSGAASTRPVPRDEIPCTAPRDRPREIHCHSAATPAGRTQTAPHRGRARHSPRNRENSGVERARILDPGPALMRWDACRGWQAFPRASDACDRDGSLLLLKSIAHPKGTRQVESVSADGVGRYAPPQRPAAQCGLRISAPSHGRPVKPHPIQLCSSCFSRPAPLVLRLFSVAPKGPRLPAPPRREDCLHAGKNRGAPESAKRCDAFLPFTEKHFAWKTLYAQERPTRKGCPQAELRTPVCSPTRIDLEPLEEKGPPRWPKR